MEQIEKHAYEATLPAAIEAVVCFGKSWRCDTARDVRERFLREFAGAVAAVDVPLLRYEASTGFTEVT